MVLDATVRVSRMVADKFADYERRDNILAWAAPLSLMTLLFTWIASFWIGFSLLDFGFTHFTFSAAMRQAGSSIATLGFAASPSGSLTILDIAASITGMVVVALQIAYLPTLYAAYNRREALITVLSARGGEPAWGPEILARHMWLNLEGNLPELYSNWETWAATVSESHTSYPVLIHFRSPQPLRSWLIALLGVMDAAALQTALAPTTAPVEARLLLQMGYLTLRDLAAIESIPTRRDPSPDDPIQLPYDEFEQAVEMLSSIGFQVERTAVEAWPHFRGWRVNYEDAAYALASTSMRCPHGGRGRGAARSSRSRRSGRSTGSRRRPTFQWAATQWAASWPRKVSEPITVPSSACNGVAMASRVSVTPSDLRSRTRPRFNTPVAIACVGGTSVSSGIGSAALLKSTRVNTSPTNRRPTSSTGASANNAAAEAESPAMRPSRFNTMHGSADVATTVTHARNVSRSGASSGDPR